MLGIKMMNLAHLLAYAPIPTELYSWPIIKWVCLSQRPTQSLTKRIATLCLSFSILCECMVKASVVNPKFYCFWKQVEDQLIYKLSASYHPDHQRSWDPWSYEVLGHKKVIVCLFVRVWFVRNGQTKEKNKLFSHWHFVCKYLTVI